MARLAWLITMGLLAAPTARAVSGDVTRGAELYRACVSCHALDPGLHLTGPSLGGVWLRPAGTAAGYARYSDALAGAGFPWDAAALDAWLASPRAMLPGTTMAFAGIGDAAARADLVAFLERAGAPGGPERLVAEGIMPRAYLRAQAPEPLRDAPPEARVTAMRHCGDGYVVETADGGEAVHWEQNVRLKIDSTQTGPPPGVGVMLGAGMQGDRYSVIFASLADREPPTRGNTMTMRLRTVLAAGAIAALIAPAVRAHHPGTDLDRLMGHRERYFQPIDEPAPPFELADADGNAVRLADFAGKIVVLNFIFASCTDFCPLHSELIAEVQAGINAAPMKDMVQFVTVTTDPAADTPDVLRSYGAAHGLDPYNWVFLTAGPGQPEDATRTLAEAYGMKFVQVDGGQQMHAVVTHVIDRSGRFAAKFHGLRFDPVNLVLYVNGLTNAEQDPLPRRSWWHSVRSVFQN